MIKFLSTWIGQIAISVIIVSIFEMLIPSGNLKKYIKVILSVYIIYCMISPFTNNKKLFNFEDINLDKYLENTKNKGIASQESMDQRLEQLYIEELKKNIENKVNENGYEILKCKIDATLNNNSANAGIHNINLLIKKRQNCNNKIDISAKYCPECGTEQPEEEVHEVEVVNDEETVNPENGAEEASDEAEEAVKDAVEEKEEDKNE